MIFISNVTKKFLKFSSFINLFSYYLNLKKVKKITALQAISLHIEEGEIFGIFGKNGAGKTTLLKILNGLLLCDEGEVIIDMGKPSWPQTKKKIGYIGSGERSFFWRISGRENLYFFGRLYGLSIKEIDKAIKELSSLFDLDNFLDLDFNKYSSGMRQKLNLVRALLHKPRILLLDEPISSLDIISQHKFLEFIKKAKNRYNLTVLWSSSNPQELERICSTIAIMEKGRLIWQGKPQDFKINFADGFTTFYKTISETEIPKTKIHLLEKQKAKVIFKKENKGIPKTIIYFLKVIPAFIRKDYKNQLSYKFSFFLRLIGTITPVFTFFFLSRLFGKHINPYISPYADDYFSFVLIGIAFVGYINTALTSFSSKLRLSQTTGTLEHILATPINLSFYLLGSVFLPFIITSFRFLICLLMGITLGANFVFQPESLFAAFIIFILGISITSCLGIICAAFTMVFKESSFLNVFLQHYIKLLAGVYYPIKVLPLPLQYISYLNPFTYFFKALRLALFQGYAFSQISSFALTLFLFLIILLPLSIYLFYGATQRAKKEGTLSSY